LHWRHKGDEGNVLFAAAGYGLFAPMIVLFDQSWWVILVVIGIHYFSAKRIATSIFKSAALLRSSIEQA
jgi:hypothetical protein